MNYVNFKSVTVVSLRVGVMIGNVCCMWRA